MMRLQQNSYSLLLHRISQKRPFLIYSHYIKTSIQLDLVKEYLSFHQDKHFFMLNIQYIHPILIIVLMFLIFFLLLLFHLLPQVIESKNQLYLFLEYF